MQKVSIRQPLMIYALVFVVLTGFVVLTVASFSLVNASRRAYRRATLEHARAMARTVSVEDLLAQPSRYSENSVVFKAVTASTSSFGLSLNEARQIAARPEGNSTFIAVAFPSAGSESYLVGALDTTTSKSIAFVEISRMVPLVLVAALACAAVLSFLMSRLLLPSLDALAEVAKNTRAEPGDGLVPSDAPNEIIEVARRFRHTVRLLNQERERVEAQKDELEHMQDRLIRASKLASVGRLAAGIAHEIGNPLAAVRGYLSLMKDGLLEPQRTEVLDRSSKELSRIHETIQKLLAYARPGESSAEPIIPLSTRRVVEDTLSLVRGHPALREVKIEHSWDGRDEPDAEGHALRLGQVLVNLLLNAGQAMAAESNRKITIRHTSSEKDRLLSIQDTGPGIPPDALEAVFDPFFTTKAPGEGTGLGLAVSRASIEAMDGDLNVHSTNDSGACFTIRLRQTGHSTSDSEVS